MRYSNTELIVANLIIFDSSKGEKGKERLRELLPLCHFHYEEEFGSIVFSPFKYAEDSVIYNVDFIINYKTGNVTGGKSRTRDQKRYYITMFPQHILDLLHTIRVMES